MPGEPTRYRPAAAVFEGAWAPTIPAAAVGGAEADLWSPGRTGNVIRALSLVPDEVRQLSQLGAAHYLPFNRMMDLRAWHRLARAGTWWTGAERVAIAAEVRNAARCRACHERKSALSPAAVTAPHDSVSALRPAALDAVHRITRAPAPT